MEEEEEEEGGGEGDALLWTDGSLLTEKTDLMMRDETVSSVVVKTRGRSCRVPLAWSPVQRERRRPCGGEVMQRLSGRAAADLARSISRRASESEGEVEVVGGPLTGEKRLSLAPSLVNESGSPLQKRH